MQALAEEVFMNKHVQEGCADVGVPSYQPHPACMADYPNNRPLFGVPSRCTFDDCMATCIPQLDRRDQIVPGTIPRTTCENTKKFEQANDVVTTITRTRSLFARLLERAVDTSAIDGRPVAVTLHHRQPDEPVQNSTSAVDALENYKKYLGSEDEIGLRRIRIDMPIRPGLAMTATRLCVQLDAPSGQEHTYGYNLTTYAPPGEDESNFVVPSQPHFVRDNVRSSFHVRNYGSSSEPNYRIRTITQPLADPTTHGTFMDDRRALQAAYREREYPRYTPQEEQGMALGAYAFARSQLLQTLVVMDALAQPAA